MDNRIDKSVSFSGGTQKNINVNTGNGEISQNVSSSESSNGDLDALFDKLLAEIPKLSPADEVEDALDNAEKLKSAVESEDKPRAKKLFGWLPTAVQASSTAMDIFKLFGD
ncbi:hypothetical protein [Cytobacillus firmus]|uniref:hypothetical protein n=1 Tax=Cytobacillus firmus TaxID=1399 RepID=UPI0018CD73D8|nr:hypothetical protein [Cytobacillus firmus]MBG9550020.1 hypothetical protein [Cytobacillus firmus]MBG9604012.1 hypothetical protein [Cytobacillus firmus]MED1940805.1 hypothetical protein [Cytobacillus firmus]